MTLNPAILLFTMLGIGIQVAFAPSALVNGIFISLSILYLLNKPVKWRLIGLVLLMTLPLALGTAGSFLFFGTGNVWPTITLQVSRLYVYLFLGMTLTMTTSAQQLLMNLVMHLKLPTTFAYGTLVALNLGPRVRHQVKVIRYSANLRGITYHFWQPQLYFKAVLSALRWSQDLAEAMVSRGFSEGYPRTKTPADPLPKWQWGVSVLLILAYAGMQFFMF